ncbi:BT1926 family outer membrane beta-barrel protein [uncultured Bacteroides sp.]|uniref:BT1926 family outer membrane beta-barrel protein n=1 Tax=uncultured Bacteroides sp. TaxID=162156 RepID=UPI00263997E6|nr:BT1926 family outer membrane beta-barrel protein [uncultured Bacteroides sp.]
MIKKLCILLLSVCTVAPGMAQQYSSSDASFAPKKGQWQVSAVIGNNQMFDQNMEYLLPTYWNGSTNSEFAFNNPVGLPGTNFQSGDPGYWLNLGKLNSNTLMNLIGIQGKYFLTDRWDINAMFSMNINATPSRDYIEGDHSVPEFPIQDYKYIEGRIQNAWTVQLGSNYYFNTKNERINLYLGGVLGWQMGRIETSYPYTGETVIDEDMSEETDEDLNTESVQLYTPNSRAGQIFGLRVGAVAGIEYSIAKGLIFGFEVQPVSYRYDCIQICPKGSAVYQAGHHSIGLFATPNLKIGFRF